MNQHPSDTESQSDSEWPSALDLQVQAYVDGELSPEDRLLLEQRLSAEPELQDLATRLQQWVRQIRDHEPVHPLDVHRDFYFAAIERRLEAVTETTVFVRPNRNDSARILPKSLGAQPESGWWRWFAPGFAVVALALLVVVLVQLPRQAASNLGLQAVERPYSVSVAGEELIGATSGQLAGASLDPIAAVASWTYQSDADAITIHWIN